MAKNVIVWRIQLQSIDNVDASMPMTQRWHSFFSLFFFCTSLLWKICYLVKFKMNGFCVQTIENEQRNEEKWSRRKKKSNEIIVSDIDVKIDADLNHSRLYFTERKRDRKEEKAVFAMLDFDEKCCYCGFFVFSLDKHSLWVDQFPFNGFVVGRPFFDLFVCILSHLVLSTIYFLMYSILKVVGIKQTNEYGKN